MKVPVVLTGLLLLVPSVHADLVITEIMSSSNHSNTQTNGDWWELTNNGVAAVNVGGYSWDDENPVSGQQVFISRVINPGESIIILDEANSLNVPAFRTAWNIPVSVVVLTEADFGGYPGFSGGSGDSLTLFDPLGVVVDSWTFGPASDGRTFARFSDGTDVPGGVSTDGIYGAVTSTDATPDVGSPGSVADSPNPESPTFLEPFVFSWPADTSLAGSTFRVRATDANLGDNLSFTVLNKPAWMIITDEGDGTASLSGTPTQLNVGAHNFEVEVEDDSGLTPAEQQTYTIHVLPAQSPVILNEYNAVAPTTFLDGGGAGDAQGKTDTFFGRIRGNGGAWVEFVVVGDGTAGGTSDLREWSIEIVSATATRTLKLSNHAAWAAVPTGTVLTFTALNTGQGGLDTTLNRVSDLSGSGKLWSNVWMYDPILINQGSSSHPLAFPAIGSEDTTVILKNAGGAWVYGPAGESVATEDTNNDNTPDGLVSLSNLQVFKLEENPLLGADPYFGGYLDGTSSTFGEGNVWNGGLNVQSFASYVHTNTPPTVLNMPPTYAARGAYSFLLEATDPNGQTPAFTAPVLPSFLSLTDHGNGTATLESNRALEVGDIGDYEVSILLDDGQGSANTTYLPFTLTVLHPAPSVILNEYNAVALGSFLNGGTFVLDSDGLPNAVDSHFGRLAGNGSNWFELVVTGDGGPGEVDLRGWQIEVGKEDAGGAFAASHTITLTNDTYWATVPAGTILTFITQPTAGGGLDTDLNRVDMLDTKGYMWSNIYLGDASLVSGSNLLFIDIDQNGSQIKILDDGGVPIFGPAGEGVSPESGIGSTEILELEGHPSPEVSPFDVSTPTEQGYDDGSSGSTFGSPNSFFDLDGVTSISQNFSRYSTNPYVIWAGSFGLEDLSLSSDSDGDDATNLEEYLFGGNPADPSSFPVLTADASGFSIDLRIDDPAYTPVAQWSVNLQDWFSSDLAPAGDGISSFGSSYVRRTFSYTGTAAPTLFFRVIAP